MKRLAILALSFLAFWATAAQAQEQDPTSGWEADLGAVARVRPDHLGSKQYMVDAMPVIEAHLGDRVQLSLDDGAKWAVVRSGPWSAGPIAEYRQAYSDHLPSGSHHLTDAVEIGGFGSYRLPFGQVEVRLRRAVDGYEGWSGDLSFDTGAPISPNWKVAAQARVSWADSSFSDAYFNLRHSVARREGLPVFGENDFYTAGIEVDAARRLTPKTQLIISLADDHILGELGHTPILHTRNLATLSIGMTYHWAARSPSP